VCFSNSNREMSRHVLDELGFPFAKQERKK